MIKLFSLLGCIAGFLGVGIGAFAAHALKTKLSAEMFAIFEVGVRYQFYHAFALFVVAWACSQWPQSNFSNCGWLFVGGIFIFSGSLYILSLSGLRFLGAITPIGGLMFLAGWLLLFFKILRSV